MVSKGRSILVAIAFLFASFTVCSAAAVPAVDGQWLKDLNYSGGQKCEPWVARASSRNLGHTVLTIPVQFLDFFMNFM